MTIDTKRNLTTLEEVNLGSLNMEFLFTTVPATEDTAGNLHVKSLLTIVHITDDTLQAVSTMQLLLTRVPVIEDILHNFIWSPSLQQFQLQKTSYAFSMWGPCL
jgi:hypothetical protein